MNVDSLATTTDKNSVLSDLEKLEALRHRNNDVSGPMSELVSPLTIHLLELSKQPTLSQIHEAKETLNSLPITQVTLANYPTQEQLTLVLRWARQFLHPEVILEITIDPQLIGGIQINWQGVFFDGGLG